MTAVSTAEPTATGPTVAVAICTFRRDQQLTDLLRRISSLAATEVPVARALALCEDPAVIGSAFYVMDCVDGRILWDPSLPGMSPAERGAIFDEMNRVIAALHKVCLLYTSDAADE